MSVRNVTILLILLLYGSFSERLYAQAAKHEIPVLSYHQVRNWNVNDSRTAHVYIIPVNTFRSHMKALHDSGYQTILPDQLLAYLKDGTPLPGKPVMLTFDDGTASQYENALPVLDEYGFKAVFFIMTVTLDRPGYMTREQVKKLADAGHVIGCHTWDHHSVTKYTESDWTTQLYKPTKLLEKITGRPIKYFAYPFGSWNSAAIEQLKKHSYQAAFQLSGKIDADDPLFTIQRLIADGNWNAQSLLAFIKKNFH